MRYSYHLITMSFVVLLLSCKKEHAINSAKLPAAPSKHILLKDITIPNLPSPYYHFEYNTDSLVTKADFASGFSTYYVLYGGNKINCF
jgi:hypothetical protein